jgi:hypothetical protein
MDLRLSALKIRQRDIHIVFRDKLLSHKRLSAIQFAFALGLISPCPRCVCFDHFQIASSLIPSSLERLWIDHSHDVACLHHRIEIGV